MQKAQSLITLLAVALAILLMTGVINPYKKQYLRELKAQEDASKARVDSLQAEIEIIEEKNRLLEQRADSIYKVLGTSEKKRKKERDEHNRKMAELNKLAPSELPGYFSERYNRK